MTAWVTRKGREFWCSKSEFRSLHLPYGTYYREDEREVLFDRQYAPLCERRPGQPPQLADPKEWVKCARQEWLYEPETPGAVKKERQIAKLKEWGMLEVVNSEIERLMKTSRFRQQELRRQAYAAGRPG